MISLPERWTESEGISTASEGMLHSKLTLRHRAFISQAHYMIRILLRSERPVIVIWSTIVMVDLLMARSTTLRA